MLGWRRSWGRETSIFGLRPVGGDLVRATVGGHGTKMVVLGVMMEARASREAKQVIGNYVAVIGKNNLG